MPAVTQKAECDQPPSGPTNSVTGQRNITFSTTNAPSAGDSRKFSKQSTSAVTYGQFGGFGGPRKRLDLGKGR